MNKPKVLILIDWFLPGTGAGGPVRSVANLVQHLKAFNFYIITTNTDYCADEPYPDIAANQWLHFSENTQVYYFSKTALNRKRLEAVINDAGCDVIYINGIYSKYFSRLPLTIAVKKGMKTIVATRGMLSPHALGVKKYKKKAFILAQNMRQQYARVHFHVTHEEERRDVMKIIKAYKAIHVIPNLPRWTPAEDLSYLQKDSGHLKLISLGRIAEEKGTLIGLKALQEVEGHIQLDLYGAIYNQEYWKACLTVIAALPERIAVNYRGELSSEAVPEQLKAYHFLLLPSKGENFGHAIVEAFIAGRPVIISKHTPWKYLEDEKTGFDVDAPQLSEALQKAVQMNNTAYALWCRCAHQKGMRIVGDTTTVNQYQQLFS